MVRGSWLRMKREAKHEGEVPPPHEKAQRPDVEEHAATERERQLHGLAVLSLFLHSTATVEEMMSMLLAQAPTVTGAVLVYPLLLERKRQLLKASILQGCGDDRLEAAMDAFQDDLTEREFSLAQNQELRRILERGEVALCDDFSVLMDGVMPEKQWKEAQKTLGVRRLAVVPMVVENEPLGMVVFAFDEDEIDVEALELLVGHLTLALRDLLVRDEAVRFSDVDAATWVHNRRYLMHALETEAVRAGRYDRSFALVVLDIDGFTEFNSTYGQSIGDRLLRAVATTLAETVSPPELVARLKDDDFAVLLPETGLQEAVATTTQLLAGLAQVSVFGGEDDEAQPVTVSVAIACFPEDAGSPHALLEGALADLETAKRERAAEQTSSERRELAGGGTEHVRTA